MKSQTHFEKPALSLAAVPGRRQRTLELAKEIEARGYSGIYCPSFGDCMSLCLGIAFVTDRIKFGTSVAPIYFRTVEDFAQNASFIHEVSKGRFQFGIGVSHEPVLASRGIKGGQPLKAIRTFVDQFRATRRAGELPPIVLAALRKKMIMLAGDISSGLVFANAARSYMTESLSVLPTLHPGAEPFFVGNMIPTCIDSDLSACRAVLRKTLTNYVRLPNYRNYWKAAGYTEEMNDVEQALLQGDDDRVEECLSDRWLADTTIAGPRNRLRESLEAWADVGVTTPILVPSSVGGGQLQAFTALFKAFD